LGLSQEAVGVRAGIDPSVASARMNQYERQVHQPAFAVVQKLARVLRRPTPYFYAVDEALAELIAIYGELPPTSKEHLLEIARQTLASD